MPRPIILAVDDEPQVLRAIGRDLRQRYGGDYQIVEAGSGNEALEALRALKGRGSPLALLVADQRMPEMTGTEFLARAIALYPDVRKVLLTAYADTEAAIDSINEVGLDHYLLKPWDPPEDRLYPVLDDLLDEWRAGAVLPFEGIRVAGTLWSAASHHVKDFLGRNRIPYQWLDLETDGEARALVDGLGDGSTQLPVVFFPSGDVLRNPSHAELAERVGLRTRAAEPFYDLIIVGAGPAGLGAAVYGASEGLSTALIEREATGGQAGTSSRIENYLGFPKGLSGADLARRATAQALRLGAEILTARTCTGVRVEDPYRIVILDDGTELACRALVIATGVTLKRLKAPGVERLTGAGIYYGAAMTEAAHYRDAPMLVVGGANSAGQGAMFFSRFASRVTMLVRGSGLEASMSRYLIDQIAATQNIDVVTRTEVIEALGDRRLEAVRLRHKDTGRVEEMAARAMFLLIGAVPHSELVGSLVETNHAGFVLTGPDLMRRGRRPAGWALKRDPYLLETSIPGVFAAGDVRQGAVRRVASAVGEGAVAISFVHQYLKTV